MCLETVHSTFPSGASREFGRLRSWQHRDEENDDDCDPEETFRLRDDGIAPKPNPAVPIHGCFAMAYAMTMDAIVHGSG